MNYINTYKLIYGMLTGKKLDSRALLAEVNRKEVEKALSKTKEGLPKPFICTNEPMEEENLAKLPYSDKEKLWDIFDRLKKFRKDAEKELPNLLELRNKYPNVPAIYNYIGIVYASTDQDGKYYNNIIETTKKFPDYLFGKSALAEYYIKKNKYKEVPKVLDKKLEIYMHYPSSVKKFHVSEVRAFYTTVGIYYARSSKTARALFCYFILNQIDPKHGATQKLADEIVLMEIEKLRVGTKINSHFQGQYHLLFL